jgi:hypothetical protein
MRQYRLRVFLATSKICVQNLIQFDKFRRVSYQITRGQYDGAQTGPVSHDAITRSLMKFSSQFITIVKRYIPTDKS